MVLLDAGGHAYIKDARGVSRTGELKVVPADDEIQEDTFILTWDGQGQMLIDGPRANLLAIAGENPALELVYQVIESDAEQVTLGIGPGILDMSGEIAARAGDGWQISRIPLNCFAEAGADLSAVTEPLIIEATGALQLQVKSARIDGTATDSDCSL